MRCGPVDWWGFLRFFRYPGKAISAEAIGDVSGKGAPAAIYAGLVGGILRSVAPLELGPAEMLRTLNSIFVAVASHAKGLEAFDDQTVVAVRT
jgi:serine phosphatase RsbU (regulator of sigma subunit)